MILNIALILSLLFIIVGLLADAGMYVRLELERRARGGKHRA